MAITNAFDTTDFDARNAELVRRRFDNLIASGLHRGGHVDVGDLRGESGLIKRDFWAALTLLVRDGLLDLTHLGASGVGVKATRGGRQDAAKLLGWGRNTLTRKLKELGMEDL